MTAEELQTVPTLVEIVKEAKFFINDNDIQGVCCYTERRKSGFGWNGFAIALKYLHEVGYYYDITIIGTSSDLIEREFLNGLDTISSEMNIGMKWLGLCPKCNKQLWDAFSWQFHDVGNCGNKKAVKIL